MLNTIENMGELLKHFTLEKPEWGITDLAKALDWSTSKTHDLTSSLAQVGFLRQNENRRYQIGWRALELSQVILGSSTLQAEARREMEKLSAKYDDIILLGVLAGGKMLFVDKAARHSLPKTISNTDMRLNAHCTSAGKVQSLDVLNAQLERVKAQGYACGLEELALGLGSIAAPIFDYSGHVVAALSLSAENQKYKRRFEIYRDDIMHTANLISDKLGYLNVSI